MPIINGDACILAGIPTKTVGDAQLFINLNINDDVWTGDPKEARDAAVHAEIVFPVIDVDKCAVVQWRDGYAGNHLTVAPGGVLGHGTQYGVINPQTSSGLLVVDSKDTDPH